MRLTAAALVLALPFSRSFLTPKTQRHTAADNVTGGPIGRESIGTLQALEALDAFNGLSEETLTAGGSIVAAGIAAWAIAANLEKDKDTTTEEKTIQAPEKPFDKLESVSTQMVKDAPTIANEVDISGGSTKLEEGSKEMSATLAPPLVVEQTIPEAKAATSVTSDPPVVVAIPDSKKKEEFTSVRDPAMDQIDQPIPAKTMAQVALEQDSTKQLAQLARVVASTKSEADAAEQLAAERKGKGNATTVGNLQTRSSVKDYGTTGKSKTDAVEQLAAKGMSNTTAMDNLQARTSDDDEDDIEATEDDFSVTDVVSKEGEERIKDMVAARRGWVKPLSTTTPVRGRKRRFVLKVFKKIVMPWMKWNKL